MNLKTELPQKLYEQFEENNLLSLIESLMNEKNLISIEPMDFELLKNFDFVKKIDYSNYDSIPDVDFNPKGIIANFYGTSNLTLGQIEKEVVKINNKFRVNNFIYGTSIDESIGNDNVRITCLLFK